MSREGKELREKSPSPAQAEGALIDVASKPSGPVFTQASTPVLRRITDLLFYLLVAYAVVMAIPLGFVSTDPGLDRSWLFGINYFAASHYKFGSDLVFTYGPLGFVAAPEHIGHNLLIATIIRLLLAPALATILIVHYRRRPTQLTGSFVVVASLAIAHVFFTGFLDYLVAILALTHIVSRMPEEQSFARVTIPLSVLTTLAFLMKLTAYVMILSTFVAYVLAGWMFHRTQLSRKWLVRAVTVVLLPFVAYLIYNPSLAGLVSYVANGFQITSGYSVAMSLGAVSWDDRWRLVFLLLCTIGFGVFAGWRGWIPWELLACVALSFFLALKHGIVRADHLPIFYAIAPVIFALFGLRICGSKKSAVLLSAVWICVTGVSVTRGAAVWRPYDLHTWSPASQVTAAHNLMHAKQYIAGIDAQSEADLQSDRLPPSVLSRIKQSPVVIFPEEVSYGAANKLNLIPLYTLQAYTGYTTGLDHTAAEHLLQKTPPETRVLLSWGGVDYRHPLLDMPATWEALRAGFDAELEQPNVLLLKKREHARQYAFHPIRSSTADPRQWQDVPARPHAVNLAVSFSYSLGGQVRRFLYRIEPVYMDFETDLGTSHFRVIPEVLQHPFLINCLPLSPADMDLLLFENSCQQRVKRFRFSGDGLSSYSSAVTADFAEAPDEALKFGRSTHLPPTRDTLPSDIGPVWAGAVDYINGPGPFGTSAATAARVRGQLEIDGWAVPDANADGPFDTIYVVLGNYQFRSAIVLRPDVATYLKNPNIVRCGFRAVIDTTDLPKGPYPVRLVGLTKDGTYYRCPNSFFIRIE